MEFKKMIEVMVAAVNALDNNEIADDLMEVATTCEELWSNEIQEEEE